MFLKNSNQSIHWQNSQLYIWGLFFSLTVLFTRGDPRGMAVFWDGHDMMSILLVFSLALTGLATAFVLKYLDNIAKNFAVVAAMFVAALVSVVFFDTKFTLHLGIGLAISCIATDLYVRDSMAKSKVPEATSTKDELRPILAAKDEETGGMGKGK